jgi:hypothetical protein
VIQIPKLGVRSTFLFSGLQSSCIFRKVSFHKDLEIKCNAMRKLLAGELWVVRAKESKSGGKAGGKMLLGACILWVARRMEVVFHVPNHWLYA